jgi:hypothetical protein
MSKEQILQNKKSFLLHMDSLDILDEMTNEQAGIFIKSIFHFQKNGILPDLDVSLKFALQSFINQFKRDNEKWEAVREKRSQAGKVSANRRQQMSTHVEGVEQNSTNVNTCQHLPTVNVSVNDSVSVSDNVNDTDIKKNKIKKIEFDYSGFNDVEIFAIKRWLDYRKVIKKSYKTQFALDQLRKKLLSFIEDNVLVEAIEHSMAEEWQGVFAPKERRYSAQEHSLKSAIHNCNEQDFDNKEF